MLAYLCSPILLLMSAKIRLQKALEYAHENRPQTGGFPFLAECLRQAGVTHNIWALPAVKSTYMMEGGWVINDGPPLVISTTAVPTFNQETLITALRTNQAGESTFPEFLVAAWQAGVVLYDVDFLKRTVTYQGSNNEQYIEAYPGQRVGEGYHGPFSYNLSQAERKKLRKLLKEKGIKILAYGVVDKGYYTKNDLEKYFRTLEFRDANYDNPFTEPVTPYYNVKGGLGIFSTSGKSTSKSFIIK